MIMEEYKMENVNHVNFFKKKVKIVESIVEEKIVEEVKEIVVKEKPVVIEKPVKERKIRFKKRK